MGDRLRKARSLTGMTVAEFAAATLISAKSINNYENDRYAPRPLVLRRWAEVTGVSEEWLVSDNLCYLTPPASFLPPAA